MPQKMSSRYLNSDILPYSYDVSWTWARNPYDSWRPGRWLQFPLILKVLEHHITKAWDKDVMEHEHYMYERNEGGGLYGVDPTFHRVREGLVRQGRDILKKEEAESGRS